MKNQEIIYIAALLHDIGIFIEKAKRGGTAVYTDKIQKYKNFNENSNHANHKFYSAFFVDELNFLKKEIKEIILKHHLAKNFINAGESLHLEKQIIRLSDVLSSKERFNAEEDEPNNMKLYSESALMSVFCNVKTDKIKYEYYDAKKLDLINIFPNNITGENEQNELNNYIENTIQKLITISNTNLLYPFFEKYFSYFPAQTPSEKYKYFPDVSLFDHLKTTAAISVCLFKECRNNKEFREKIENYQYVKRKSEYVIYPKELTDKYKPFILLQCDFSGILKFIFDVENKNAASILKGKSIYLQILSEIITKYIIKELALEEANIISNSGGNFHILIPQCLKEKAEKCQKNISEIIYKAHKGNLYSAFGYTQLSINDFENFSGKWHKTNHIVNQNKINKFKETDYKIGNKSIFETFDEFENIKIEKNKNKYKTEFYKSFAELTNDIKQANYIEYLEIKEKKLDLTKQKLPNSYSEIFNAFGYEVEFYKNKPEKSANSIIYKLNCTDFDNLDGFRFMVNKLPEEQIFGDIAAKSKGHKKLGLLKMDVDNLDLIFHDGFGENDRSISRVATLSRNIRLFFEGYINTILDDRKFTKNNKRLIYPIYSGGDDLILIGAYDKMIGITKRIKNDFYKFTAKNPKITISATLVITDDKFPLLEAIKIVETDLKKAKASLNKNRITFMGEIFTWEEFEKIIEMKNLLVELIEKKGESRTLLKKINNSTNGFKRILEDSNKNILDIQKIWRFRYYLRTMQEKNKKDKKKLIDWYENILLKNTFENNKIKNIMMLPVACRLAELLTKKM